MPERDLIEEAHIRLADDALVIVIGGVAFAFPQGEGPPEEEIMDLREEDTR